MTEILDEMSAYFFVLIENVSRDNRISLRSNIERNSL